MANILQGLKIPRTSDDWRSIEETTNLDEQEMIYIKRAQEGEPPHQTEALEYWMGVLERTERFYKRPDKAGVLYWAYEIAATCSNRLQWAGNQHYLEEAVLRAKAMGQTGYVDSGILHIYQTLERALSEGADEEEMEQLKAMAGIESEGIEGLVADAFDRMWDFFCEAGGEHKHTRKTEMDTIRTYTLGERERSILRTISNQAERGNRTTKFAFGRAILEYAGRVLN